MSHGTGAKDRATDLCALESWDQFNESWHVYKLQCVAVCGSVWQCVAVCVSVLQCGAVWCNVVQCGAV